MSNRESPRIDVFYRLLAHWFHPRSYRPLVLLFAVSMAVFLFPLFVVVAFALFFRIPNGLRKAMGQVMLLAILAVGLRRLWRVQPTDSWPSEHDPDAGLLRDRAAR